VLPGAIDKAIYLAIKPNHTDTINVFSFDYNQMVSFVPLREKLDEHWANYILGVVMELRETGALAGGFDGVFGGDIPLGAGMMGGGFGGCTINLVSEQAHDGFIDQAKTQFFEKFGQEPRVYDVVISNGARKL